MSLVETVVACTDGDRRRELMNILGKVGLDPAVASNVHEVRTLLGRRPVHIVFCEDDLPMGGFREVLRLVGSTGFRTRVVVASALGDLDEYLIAMQLGAFDFIAPPYRIDDIVSILNNASRDFSQPAKPGRSMYYVYAEGPRRGNATVTQN